MDEVGSITRFNGFVKKMIREHGTCKLAEQTNDRIACFEVASAGGVKGFVGWWEDDHSQMTYAATPYEVYCTMPHEDQYSFQEMPVDPSGSPVAFGTPLAPPRRRKSFDTNDLRRF